MKASDLRDLSSEDLMEKLDDAGDELLRLRFQRASGVLQNPIRLRLLRRERGRIKTILKERELRLRS